MKPMILMLSVSRFYSSVAFIQKNMKAVIVGGGIIGLCSAWYLQQTGWSVTVLERGDLTDNCSFGNAGMIAPSHFTPLASPGIISQGIRWMLDSKSPFYIKPSLNPSLIRWGLRFIRHANAKNVTHGLPYLRDISLLSHQLYQELEIKPGFDFSLEQKGVMMYFKSDKTAEEESHLAERARSIGLDAELLSREQVEKLEPGLRINIRGAVHYRCDAHLYPKALMEQLSASIVQNGGIILTQSEVKYISLGKNKIKKIITDNKEFDADVFIIAGGSWLPGLTRMAGVSVPLMPGKGYSVTIKRPPFRLNIPAILLEARVAITPMNGFMRFGGTMEIAPVNNKINLNRVTGIIESIPEYFPDMKLDMPDTKDIWYGFRPCSPDGLPYIGFSKKVKNMIIAGGHSMMGLGLGPATGKLVSELANGTPLSVKADAFDPERFS
jgi:D-amino-acid dehydrogenase